MKEYQIKDTYYYPIHEVHKAGCKDLKKEAAQTSSVLKGNSPREIVLKDKTADETEEDYKIMNCCLT